MTMKVMYPTDETGSAEANGISTRRSLIYLEDLSDRGMLVRIYFQMKAERAAANTIGR